jgi:hypothetical protein
LILANFAALFYVTIFLDIRHDEFNMNRHSVFEFGNIEYSYDDSLPGFAFLSILNSAANSMKQVCELYVSSISDFWE